MNEPDMNEIERLKTRIQDLAKDKSRSQMLTDILRELASARGLDEVVNKAISTIMNAWGGSNIILYYCIDEKWFKRDLYNSKERLDSIDDSDVSRALKDGCFLELPYDDRIPISLGKASMTQTTWIYPLKREGLPFGVLKMEGVFLNENEDVKHGLSLIVDYLSMVLQNGILTEGKLMAANEALREEMARRLAEETQYRKTIENSFDGYVVVDTEGRFVEVNDIYCRMTGYSREELLSRGIKDVEVIEDREDTRKRLELIRKKGKELFETRHRCRDGKTIEVEVNCIYTGYGDRDGLYYSFLRDVTEKKKMEEQYIQAQKVESIGRLAGGVAHDLNNLLSPILGYSEILSMSFPGDDKRKGQAELILDASLRARDLVRQLLAFSRKQNLEYRHIRPDDIIRGFETLLRRTIRENILFHFDLNAPYAVIKADSGQLEQVLMNLAVNAQDAMPEGGLLEIRTELTSLEEDRDDLSLPPGNYVILSLTDTGSGMDEATRSQIFEPFFSTKGEQGTGLGLSTVYGIVKQHNGEIEVQSRPGKGSSFIIYLPTAREVHEAEGLTDTGVSHEIPEARILLVEDDEHVRELATDILSQEKFQVFTASSGEEALELLNNGSISVDLLLTDVVMPGMSGRELFSRACEILPDLRAVYMSGYSDKSFNSDGDSRMKTAYLQKPFTIRNLTGIVHKVLSADL